MQKQDFVEIFSYAVSPNAYLYREIAIDKQTFKTTPLLWPWRRFFAAAVIDDD
jgi:hypothetical protein